MAQRVLSISLGSEIVKVCEVALAGKKRIQIFNAIDLMIPAGLCDDGVVLDPEGLAATILQGLSGEGFSAKKIVFAIATKRIASKEAVIPYCKENRIKQIVEINASEYFPVANISDYVINYSILEVLNEDAVKNYRLSVIATPKDILEGYYELAKAMGMPIVSIDFAGNASLQLLKLQTPGNEVDAIIQLGAESSIINIMDGSTMIMQRNIPYGRASLIEAVKEYRLVPEGVADAILMEEDIAYLANSSVEVADAVRTLFSSMNRIIEFYSSRNQDKPIQHIYMIGDVVSVCGLVELFNNEWEHSVELIEYIHGIEIKNHKQINNEIAANYIVNMGAVIAPMNIELVDEKKSKSKSSGLPWWLLIFSTVVAAAMVGGILFIYFEEKNEVDLLNKQIAAYDGMESLEDDYRAAQLEASTLKDWYESTKGSNESLARFVDDLEHVQPSAVAITKLTTKEGEVTIEGLSYGKPALAEFIIQLKALPYVSNVKTEYINETIVDYTAKDQFQLTFNLQYADPYAEDLEDSDDMQENKNVVSVEEVEPNNNDAEIDSFEEDIASDMEGGDIQ